MAKDYYKTLETEKSASKEEIKKAYKKLAKKYHPDISKEKDADMKFKEINEAASVLLDDEKRKRYDTYGSAEGPSGFSGGFSGGGFNPEDFGINLDDIFEHFGFGGGFSNGFGGFGNSYGQTSRNQRNDTRVYEEINVSLEDVYFGVEKDIKITIDEKCPSCNGKGAEDPSDVEICSNCNGAGVVIEVQRSILGAIKTQRICSECNGKGKKIKNPCSTCNGRGVKSSKTSVNIKIPKGIENGVTLKASGKGSYDPVSQSYGDLYLKIYIKKHKTFDVDGSDLYMNLDINFVQAIIGDEIEFKHFDKTLNLKIPAGTQPGTILRLKGKGMPYFNYNSNGDLYVKINVEIPTKTTNKQKQLLMEYAKTLKDKNIFDRMKNFFN